MREAEQNTSLAAYANLLKSSWIVTDVIAQHPQMSFVLSKACSFQHSVPCIASKFTQARRAEVILTITGGEVVLYLDSHHAYLELSESSFRDQDAPLNVRETCKKRLRVEARERGPSSARFHVIHQETNLDLSIQCIGDRFQRGSLSIINGESRGFIKDGLPTAFRHCRKPWKSTVISLDNVELDPNAEIIEPKLSDQ